MFFEAVEKFRTSLREVFIVGSNCIKGGMPEAVGL